MSTEPGADELRIRSLLVAHGVGPDAVPPKPTAPAPAAPSPTGAPKRDWWDAVYKDDRADQDTFTGNTPTPPPGEPPPDAVPDRDQDDTNENTPEPDADDEPEQRPEPKKKQAGRNPRPKNSGREKPEPGAPRAGVDSRPVSPRQSLADAWGNIPPRLKWLAYHASAAYLGWSTGLVGWSTYVTAWIAHTGFAGPQAVFWYVAAAGTVLVYRRSRNWWTPVAWLAAVPVSSTVVGVLLYGTPNP